MKNEQNAFEADHVCIAHVDPDLEDLIPGYLENRHADVKTIEAALNAEAFEDIRRLAHSMKGSGGGYGFDDITEIGRHLEASAVRKDAEAIGSLVQELAQYLERVEIVFDGD